MKYGPLFVIHSVYSYLLVLIGVVIVGRFAALRGHWGPWQSLLVTDGGRSNSQREITVDIEGSDRSYDVRVWPLHDRRMRSIGRVLVLRDITERITAEKQLRESFETADNQRRELYEQAIRDPLTGSYNRRFLSEVLKKEQGRAGRGEWPISLCIVDIDLFKRINDTFGHDAGDLVLKHVAELLNQHTRVSDYVFRVGGEEFLILLAGVGIDAARVSAERWRRHLENASTPYGDQNIRVTASIGVAVLLPDGPSPEQILKQADEALYAAKLAGRNRVVVSTGHRTET